MQQGGLASILNHMLQSAADLLSSHSPWSSFFYLVVGVLLGAIASTVYALRAQSPKLIIVGGGSGGNQDGQQWSIAVSNRPSFFGRYVDGDPARELYAWLRLAEPSSQQFHQVFWEGQQPSNHPATIEAGQQKSICLFHWRRSEAGFTIVDQVGDPVARFSGGSGTQAFILRLNDRLGRSTEFPLTVRYDDSHLKNTPTLSIVHPLRFKDRMQRVAMGLRQIRMAFKKI